MARDSVGNPLVRPVTYTTSNVDVAVLDIFGLATATGEGPVTITATSSGKTATLRLFVPPDSGLYAAVTGGTPGQQVIEAIDIPNATTPGAQAKLIPADGVARFNTITSNGTYRVRAISTVDPAVGPAPLVGVALLVGLNPATVPVTLGPPSTVVSFPLKPYTATITAPTTVAVNSTVTVSWTFDESAQPLALFPDRAPVGRVYYSTTLGADLSGTSALATVTRDATTGISTFTATLPAPATPGSLYIQVAGDGALGQLVFPLVFRGQAMRVITVQ